MLPPRRYERLSRFLLRLIDSSVEPEVAGELAFALGRDFGAETAAEIAGDDVQPPVRLAPRAVAAWMDAAGYSVTLDDGAKVGEAVEGPHGQQTHERQGPHQPGHVDLRGVVLDGAQDALRHVSFFEDGEKEREARLYAGEHAGVDVEGPHHGGLDPGGAALQLQAQRLVEAHGCELAGRVVGLARGADEARRRGHVDDVPAAASDHGGQEGPGRPEQRQSVDPEGALDVLVRELQQGPAADYPGVVHEDVHRALGGEDVGGAGGDLLAVANVAGEGAHRAGAADVLTAQGPVDILV